MASNSVDQDPLEDDWEILRRDPEAHKYTTTIDMAEAIERLCKAVVEYAILLADDEWVRKKEIESKNLYPHITIIPYWDFTQKAHLWKASLSYEIIETKYVTSPHPRCEQAVEELFNSVIQAIQTKASEYAKEAEDAEKEAHTYRDTFRRLKRVSMAMGKYDISQPNLPLKEVQ